MAMRARGPLLPTVVWLASCSASPLTNDGGAAPDCGAGAAVCEGADTDALVPPENGDPPEDAGLSLDGGDTGLPGAEACVFAPRTAPLVLYYGTMKDEDGTQRDDLTFLLANPDLDVVFTIGGGSVFTRGEPAAPGDPGTGAFRDYHDHCLRLAFHMGIAPMVACLSQREDLRQGGEPVADPCQPYRSDGSTGAEDLAALWQAKLDLGWDYIAIDEIKRLGLTTDSGDTRTIDLTNDQTDLRRFVDALHALAAANPDYDRRVILFFAPHSADGPSAQLPDYRDLFTACRDHCRTVMHELYLTTREVEDGRSRVFDAVATALHDLDIPGVNRTTTAILAVGNDATAGVPWEPFDDPACDISPWDPVNPELPDLRCAALPGSGGVQKQLEAMRTGDYSRYWWGVGFYKIGAVRSADGAWTKEDFVRSTAERVDWWAHHEQP